jgi:hypothetical protein
VNKPNSGIVYQLKCIGPLPLVISSRPIYKLVIRQAFALFENRFDDNLGNQFVNKIMPEFCKTWLDNFRHNVSNDVYINGCNDKSFVANAFASRFSTAYSDKDDIKLLLDDYSDIELNAFDLVKLINVEVVDNYIV